MPPQRGPDASPKLELADKSGDKPAAAKLGRRIMSSNRGNASLDLTTSAVSVILDWPSAGLVIGIRDSLAGRTSHTRMKLLFANCRVGDSFPVRAVCAGRLRCGVMVRKMIGIAEDCWKQESSSRKAISSCDETVEATDLWRRRHVVPSSWR